MKSPSAASVDAWGRGQAIQGRAALYAGVAYLRTARCLIFPWFLVSGYLAAFAWTARNAVPIIRRFTFYISAARDRPAAPGF